MYAENSGFLNTIGLGSFDIGYIFRKFSFDSFDTKTIDLNLSKFLASIIIYKHKTFLFK